MAPDRVFYDGACGFCHRAVRFLLARDACGAAFRFAPLQGETHRRCLSGPPDAERTTQTRAAPPSNVSNASRTNARATQTRAAPSPNALNASRTQPRATQAQHPSPPGDTLLVLTARGEWLARSAAVLHLMRRLPAPWPALAALLARAPRAQLDRAYDAIARRRHGLFRRPPARCPALPEALRARFDD